MVWQHEGFSDAPVAGNRQVGHGLTQLGPVAGVLDKVRLVDDIHEVVQLGHTPEDAVEPQPKFPGILVPVPEGQQVGFAQVPVGALRVGAVISKERGEGETGVLSDLSVKRRLDNQPAGT